jgi:cobalt-zinc-cadmium efflux system outer membrane protein
VRGHRPWFCVTILLGVVALGPPGQAAEPPGGRVSVDELVARALADNPDLKATRTAIAAARGRVRQAALRPNPMLEVGGSKNVTAADNMEMIGLVWPLDLGGRKDARVGVATQELSISEAMVGDQERRLVAEVRMRAGEVLAAARDLRVTDELIAATRQLQTLIARRVAEGRAPALDAQLVLVEVMRLEAQRAGQAGRLDGLRFQLMPLIGQPPAAPPDISDRLEEPLAIPDHREAQERALKGRPDLRMATFATELARARVEKERAEGRYDLGLFGQYQRQSMGFDLSGINSAGQLQPIMDVFHYLTFGVSITLPVRNRNQGNIAAAQAELEGARQRRDAAELLVRQEVESAYTLYDGARRAETIYATQVLETARRNLDVIRQSYALGRGTLLDVVVELRRVIDLEMGYTDVLKKRWDATVEVQRAVGIVR